MIRPGLRLRLVLGAAAAAAVVLLVALLVARAEIAGLAVQSDQRLAAADIAPFMADLRHGGTERPDPPSTGVLIAIRAPNGSWSTDTMPLDVRAQLGGQPLTTIGTASAQFVVARKQFVARGGTWTIWAARDATARAALGGGIDLVLLITGLALTAAFAVAATVLVRAALRPVEQMRARASTLGADELLPVPSGRDELSRLAETLNDLVIHTRASAAHERRMIANAAHELRTPITNLRAAVDLARRNPTAPRLAEVGRLTDRLGDLAANLLELSRLDEGQRPMPTRAADLENAVLTAVDGWRTRLAGSAIDLDQASAVSEDDLLVPIDTVSIGRVVDNLLANSVRALGDAGTARVVLTINAEGLQLIVEDDGPGMPPALLAEAFDRFVRGTSEGSGLGLALVRAIAEAGGGTAELHPRQPGLRVAVRFPPFRTHRSA